MPHFATAMGSAKTGCKVTANFASLQPPHPKSY